MNDDNQSPPSPSSGDNTFEENFRKLEAFSKALQDEKVTVDELVPRMQEALNSVKLCKGILKETQTQLEKISLEFEAT